MLQSTMLSSELVLMSLTWYLAHLNPQADGCFTDGFYPDPKRGTKTRHVFFAPLHDSQHRIVLASRLERSGIRLVSNHLASQVMTNPYKEFVRASRDETAQLNELAQKVLQRSMSETYGTRVERKRSKDRKVL